MTVHTVALDGIGSVDVTVTDRGEGRPVLLLHGGAGPPSVAAFASLLADRLHVHVYAPTHPGFGGTSRPDWLNSVPRLAAVYARLLAVLDLHDVVVVGNSIGGWIAAELALADRGRVGQLVLVDAGGIVVDGPPPVDIFALSPEELSKLSFHNPAAFRIDPTKMSDQQRAGMAANRVALAVYGGRPSVGDPSLRSRLPKVEVPTLVLWGESDRVYPPDYGRAYAAAIPHAQFQILPQAGHVPQMETPEALLTAIQKFVGTAAAP